MHSGTSVSDVVCRYDNRSNEIHIRIMSEKCHPPKVVVYGVGNVLRVAATYPSDTEALRDLRVVHFGVPFVLLRVGPIIAWRNHMGEIFEKSRWELERDHMSMSYPIVAMREADGTFVRLTLVSIRKPKEAESGSDIVSLPRDDQVRPCENRSTLYVIPEHIVPPGFEVTMRSEMCLAQMVDSRACQQAFCSPQRHCIREVTFALASWIDRENVLLEMRRCSTSHLVAFKVPLQMYLRFRRELPVPDYESRPFRDCDLPLPAFGDCQDVGLNSVVPLLSTLAIRASLVDEIHFPCVISSSRPETDPTVLLTYTLLSAQCSPLESGRQTRSSALCPQVQHLEWANDLRFGCFDPSPDVTLAKSYFRGRSGVMPLHGQGKAAAFRDDEDCFAVARSGSPALPATGSTRLFITDTRSPKCQLTLAHLRVSYVDELVWPVAARRVWSKIAEVRALLFAREASRLSTLTDLPADRWCDDHEKLATNVLLQVDGYCMIEPFYMKRFPTRRSHTFFPRSKKMWLVFDGILYEGTSVSHTTSEEQLQLLQCCAMRDQDLKFVETRIIKRKKSVLVYKKLATACAAAMDISNMDGKMIFSVVVPDEGDVDRSSRPSMRLHPSRVHLGPVAFQFTVVVRIL